MKHRRCQRHPHLWMVCRRAHLPSLLSRTEQHSIHCGTSTITMDILEQKRDRVKAMNKGKCALNSVREEVRMAWECKRNATTSSHQKALGKGIPFSAAVLPFVTPCLLVSCTPCSNR